MPAATAVLSIPTIVWSGIVAAAISVAGVVLSNWSTTNRLRTQLGHDSKEKLQDRLAALRREVYLPLYMDLTTMQGHLGALASKDPTSSDFAAPIQAVTAQLSKVQLVGGPEAMKHASELTALYTESLFDLMLAAQPLHNLRTDINLADQFYNQFLQEAQRVTKDITSLNETGRQDPERMAALQHSLKGFQELYANYSEERNQAWESYNSSQAQFFAAVKEQILRIAPVQAQLLAALKNEIGVPTEASELLAQIESNQQRMEQAANKLLSGLSSAKA